MIMQLKCKLLMLLCLATATSYAQDIPSSLLNIGDSAPPLRVGKWLKGTPVNKFKQGTVYVIEFWATWCGPCKEAMPHLSALAALYKDKATFIGIDIYEYKKTSFTKVKAFVDSMGSKMEYAVAMEDSSFTKADWLDASGDKDQGIPRAFVVDAGGRLVWTGHPKNLSEVLPKIINNTWNINEALAKRNLDRHLMERDREVNNQLNLYTGDPQKPGSAKPAWALLAIDDITTSDPGLKYTPMIAYHTFYSLLQTNPKKAYEYGKTAIVTATYEGPAYDAIIDPIEHYSGKASLPIEIYGLGADAYQMMIDHLPYPAIVNLPKYYSKMAALCWRANEKFKAISAQQKAIEELKSTKDFSAADMDALQSQLTQYKKDAPATVGVTTLLKTKDGQ